MHNKEKKLIMDFKLANRLGPRAKEIRALFTLAKHSEVKQNQRGGWFFKIGANVYYIRLNNNSNIYDIARYGNIAEASRNMRLIF